MGFVVWSLRRRGKARGSAKDEILALLRLHGVPGVFFVLFYLLSIRGMELGGGPSIATSEVVASLLGLGLGGPAGGWPVVPWLIAAGLLFALGLALLIREGSDVWVFFAVAVVGLPVLFLVRRPPFLFERYFMIPYVFFLLLSAHVLGALWRQRGWQRRLLALLVLTAIMAGNIAHVRAFVEAGRGEFRQALEWVVEADSSPVVAVTGDHDFRVRKYVAFYARYLPASRKVVYLGREQLPAGGAALAAGASAGRSPSCGQRGARRGGESLSTGAGVSVARAGLLGVVRVSAGGIVLPPNPSPPNPLSHEAGRGGERPLAPPLPGVGEGAGG